MGNECKKLFAHSEELGKQITDRKDRTAIIKLTQLLQIVILVINSDRIVNVLEYKKLCQRIGLLVVNTWPWAVMNQTLHIVS